MVIGLLILLLSCITVIISSPVKGASCLYYDITVDEDVKEDVKEDLDNKGEENVIPTTIDAANLSIELAKEIYDKSNV